MHELFVKADLDQVRTTVAQRAHSRHAHLENMVWDILAEMTEMAEKEGCTTNALIALFHYEILAHRGEVPNFASFLRVTCMRYLRRASEAAAPPVQLAVVSSPASC